jgi:hypothetical protein
VKYIIPLELIELEEMNYHLAVTSTFGGGKEGLWVIDTGASKTVFDESLHEYYEPVEAGDEVTIQSAGIGEDRLNTSLGILQPFSLGSYIHQPMQVALINLSHINKLYYHVTAKEICGLIGSDFLLGHKAVIDYSRLELIIETDDE